MAVSLDAVIREAAARDPASLPLLSFVLDELYRRDIEAAGGNVLTNRSYRELGGLEGAIARHADELVGGLSAELTAALPALLLSLVEVDEDKSTATARVVRRSTLVDAAQRELADRLVAARLAVADDIGTGETLRLAHEALLANWPRLAALIEEHRDFLLVRRRLQGEAAAWRRHDRHRDFLLPAGRRLAEAEEALALRRNDLDPEIVVYDRTDRSLTSFRTGSRLPPAFLPGTSAALRPLRWRRRRKTISWPWARRPAVFSVSSTATIRARSRPS